MASTRNQVLTRDEYPDIFETKSFGPYTAPTAGNYVLSIVDKYTFLDEAWIGITARAGASGVSVRLAWAASGQTLAAAVTANQWLTDAKLLGDNSGAVVANRPEDFDVIGEIVDGIPPFSRIFMVVVGTTTSLAGLTIGTRCRERNP